MASTITGAGAGLGLSCSTTRKLTQKRNPSSSRLSFCSIKMAVSVGEEKKKKSFTLEKSEEAFSAAKEMMPGGVNSPVRAFKSVGGQPIVFDSVKGSHMKDIDGNDYIDYVGSWGPAIIGHADDEVLFFFTAICIFSIYERLSFCESLGTQDCSHSVLLEKWRIVKSRVLAALSETMKKGTSFGAPCLLENVLAEMVIKAVPSIEMVRFVNSGTEACMGVLRLARAYTGREKIIKFEGCYHGHADPFLVKAGSGVATLGLPDSPGVPKAATYETLTAPYNDIAAVENLFENNKGEICGIILEPVVGNAGFIPPKPEFINAIRRITEENNALLIFDEVMTGFRLAYGGAQEYFGITPDLTTLGKIIGGGLPVGAYGGRREIMEMVAPAGPMYQAGTLSGNPLAMTAGIHTLKRLQKPGSYEYLDKITSELVQGIIDAGKKTGHAICGGYIRGMFGFFFTEGPVYNFADAKKSDTAKFARFYQGMLREGVYFAPSQFEAGFTSLAHTAEDIQKTIAAAENGKICHVVITANPSINCKFASSLTQKYFSLIYDKRFLILHQWVYTTFYYWYGSSPLKNKPRKNRRKEHGKKHITTGRFYKYT
ncbi:hypothetical protein NC652_035284 [Populus alba x Populus x berolinensis]|nr:hypothetical protein NC652_035284 [Populus alba x Populus x berolinensis]